MAKRLRKDDEYAKLPIIMLTVRTEEDDKIRSFEIGLDNHISKPFSSRELIARIRAVLRRSGKVELKGRIEIGGVSLITEQHRVLIGEVPINVGPTEYRLMEFFLTDLDRVYSRTQLLDQVWGRYTLIGERTVDVHIRRICKILAEFGRERMIQTVRGFSAIGFRHWHSWLAPIFAHFRLGSVFWLRSLIGRTGVALAKKEKAYIAVSL